MTAKTEGQLLKTPTKNARIQYSSIPQSFNRMKYLQFIFDYEWYSINSRSNSTLPPCSLLLHSHAESLKAYPRPLSRPFVVTNVAAATFKPSGPSAYKNIWLDWRNVNQNLKVLWCGTIYHHLWNNRDDDCFPFHWKYWATTEPRELEHKWTRQ